MQHEPSLCHVGRPGGVQTGAHKSTAVAASTLRFQPEGWLDWLVVALAVSTTAVSLWAMAKSIQTTHGAASQFWSVVGAAEDQVSSPKPLNPQKSAPLNPRKRRLGLNSVHLHVISGLNLGLYDYVQT